MDEKKKEKKKKKERVDINLPKARASMKRSREMKQMRANYEDLWKLIGALLLIGVIAFILLGGINQRAAWEALKELGKNIGETFIKLFGGGSLNANENGIYWVPN